MGWGFEEPIDGGKGSNQAIAAARLGSRVAFVGCVGEDRYGKLGERFLRQAGVDIQFLKRSPTQSSLGGFVILNQQGIPAIVGLRGANGDLTEDDVETALNRLKDAQILLTQFEILPSVAMHAVSIAHQLGMTTILNPAPAPEDWIDGFHFADYLTPNETEAKSLLGLDPDSEKKPVDMALALWKKSQAGCVIVTAGSQGVFVADGNGVRHVAAPLVKAVDTTGAGDAFNASLAVGLIQGKTLAEAVEQACLVGAYTVTKQGTIPIFPTPADVEGFQAALGG
jgi:ribokinase